jgi:hypothetical protein
VGAQRKWRSGLQIEEVGTNKVDKDKHYFFIKKRGAKVGFNCFRDFGSSSFGL